MKQIHFVSVVRFSNAHAIGVAAINFAEELSGIGKRVIVITAQNDKIERKGIWVLKLGKHMPFSLQFIVVSFLTLILSTFTKNWHTFEIPSSRGLTFHAHSDFWDKSKIVGNLNIRLILRNFNRNLSKLGIRMAIKRETTVVCFPSKSLATRTDRVITTSRDYQAILPNVLSSTDDLFTLSSILERKSLLEFKIGFIAQGDSIYKGLPLAKSLVENSLQPASLLVAGLENQNDSDDGSQKPIFMGPLTRAEMREFYLEIDFLLICSTYESFSMTALEALYLGTPVIYTGEMGINEFLPKDYFFKVNPYIPLDLDLLNRAFKPNHLDYVDIVERRSRSRDILFKQLHL